MGEEPRELTRVDGFLQVLDRLLLTLKMSALLVVEPTELLQDLGVVRVSFQHPLVSTLCGLVLNFRRQ